MCCEHPYVVNYNKNNQKNKINYDYHIFYAEHRFVICLQLTEMKIHIYNKNNNLSYNLSAPLYFYLSAEHYYIV